MLSKPTSSRKTLLLLMHHFFLSRQLKLPAWIRSNEGYWNLFTAHSRIVRYISLVVSVLHSDSFRLVAGIPMSKALGSSTSVHVRLLHARI